MDYESLTLRSQHRQDITHSNMEACLAWFSGIAVFFAYLIIVKSLRFRCKKKNNAYLLGRYPDNTSLASMTNENAHMVMRYLQQYEFPFAFECSLAASLYRPYGIPNISRVLAKTKQFSTVCLASKRTADTAVLVVDLSQNPPQSEKCCAAISRMNYIHSGYQKAGLITNDNLVYTLALLAWLPIKFIERFEWRKLTEIEMCAAGVFWKSLGDAMNLSYDALRSACPQNGVEPGSNGSWEDGIHFLEDLRAWSEQYELKFMQPHALNHKAAVETEEVLLYGLPKALRGLGRHALSAMMDDRLRRAIMYAQSYSQKQRRPKSSADCSNSFPHPPKIVEKIVLGVLQLRKFILRYLSLPRFKPHLRVTQQADANGCFHRITWAAQPWYVKSTFSRRWRWQAWRDWLAGRPLPGDDTVEPQGYIVENVGPTKFKGRGLKEFNEEKERLMRMGRGKCPFG